MLLPRNSVASNRAAPRSKGKRTGRTLEASPSASVDDSPSLLTINSSDVRRALRLRNYQDANSFKFIPELVTSTGKERIREYRAALNKLPLDLRGSLEAVDKRLRSYGYSLTEWSASEAKNNLLTPFELVV